MAKPKPDLIPLRIIYDGTAPIRWTGGPGDFGLQDKAEALHPGQAGPDGAGTTTLENQA
jgi:hypothetical protein